MKAAVCHDFNTDLVIEEIQIADPVAGEIKVKMAACAICHSDIMFIEGGVKTPLPAVYGHEAAGIVEKVGPGVSNVAVGDHVVVSLIASCGECHYCSQGHRVLCEHSFHLDQNGPLSTPKGDPVLQGFRTGGFAEYVTVNASQACKVDDDLPMDIASLLGCGVITGIGAVWNSVDMPGGANVAVVGMGGVGLNTVQGAAISGAATVIGIDIAEDKLEAGKKFGATHGLNAKDPELVKKVKALTNGRGVDFVFMAAASKTAIENSMALLAKAGTMVIVGLPHKDVMTEFEPLLFAMMGQKIVGSKMGDAKISVDIPRIVALYQQGKIQLDQLITNRYPLEKINEALESTRRGEALRNVIIF